MQLSWTRTSEETYCERTVGQVCVCVCEVYANKAGNAPLHRALENAKLEAIVQLISVGASVNLENNKGVSPVDVARRISLKFEDKIISGRENGQDGTEPDDSMMHCDVYSWGNGANYQLGNGMEGIQTNPGRIPLEDFDSIKMVTHGPLASTARAQPNSKI